MILEIKKSHIGFRLGAHGEISCVGAAGEIWSDFACAAFQIFCSANVWNGLGSCGPGRFIALGFLDADFRDAANYAADFGITIRPKYKIVLLTELNVEGRSENPQGCTTPWAT